MSRQASITAVRRFAKRHHLLLQYGVDEDNLVPATSVFRHRSARDEVLAVGAVHELDIRCAQRSLPSASNGSPGSLTVTILSLAHPALDKHELLYVHRTLSAGYALTIQHLRGRWRHLQVGQGQLYTPLHLSLDEKLPQTLASAHVTVELIDNTLSLVAFPSIDKDEGLELLLDKAQRIVREMVPVNST